MRSGLQVGQAVSGTVIARAPFGVWLDIGVCFPALLVVTNMKRAQVSWITFNEYPALGERVEGWIERGVSRLVSVDLGGAERLLAAAE